MQTFLPYPDFEKTASVLDYRRLGKQRVEAMQIVNTITTGIGWIYHPATKMWENYVAALKLYHNIIIQEWIDRGYNNNMKLYKIRKVRMPWWLGIKDFHLSHQSRLIQKDPDYYGDYFPDAPTDWNYLWPSHQSFIDKYRN